MLKRSACRCHVSAPLVRKGSYGINLPGVRRKLMMQVWHGARGYSGQALKFPSLGVTQPRLIVDRVKTEAGQGGEL